MTDKLNIIVIGGGAAGFFAAIACATTYPQHQVTILEATANPLSKVKISGGGRCNVTHHCFEPSQLIQSYPRGAKALRGAFTRFQPKDTVAWFAAQGVKLKTEADGRMFPVTDNSQTIVDCLLNAAQQVGVKLLTKTPVKLVKKTVNDQFELELKNGEKLTGDRLLIATGSNPLGYRWAKNLGHSLETPVPSLFTFNIRDKQLNKLAGLSIENAYLKLLIPEKNKLEQTGALLITHWGLSGPVVLKLSAWGARILANSKYQLSLLINWLPQYNRETIVQELLNIKINLGDKKITTNYGLNLPKRLWQYLVIKLGINIDKKWSEISKKELNLLAQTLTQSQYKIEGKGVFKEEFVTCGGVNLKEINFKTMASKKCSGLYFAGEILDIDGITGGFNFQNAWTTGWLAGKAIGKIVTPPTDPKYP